MADKDTEEPTQDAPSKPSSRPTKDVENPMVFISHDSRDAELAEAFANLLTDASGGILKSFRSSDRRGTAGIEFGSEWYRAIMDKIDDATDVVALLTPRSINRPWILYESGVAKGKLGTTVLGLAIGVPLDDAATGPFAQFQNSGDDEHSLTKLVLQLIRRHPQASPREEAVCRQVRAFLEVIKTAKESIEDEPSQPGAKVDESSVAKLFEEVKLLVRDVPERVSNQMEDGRMSHRMRREHRFHPMMIKELTHRMRLKSTAEATALGLLIAVSFIRDDVPWIYELGVEYFRAVVRSDKRDIEAARRMLMEALEMGHSKFMFEFMRDETGMMMMEHIQMFMASSRDTIEDSESSSID